MIIGINHMFKFYVIPSTKNGKPSTRRAKEKSETIQTLVQADVEVCVDEIVESQCRCFCQTDKQQLFPEPLSLEKVKNNSSTLVPVSRIHQQSITGCT